MSNAPTPITAPLDQLVFRKTNAHRGRHIAVSPANSAMRHLSYARIRLGAGQPSVSFSNAGAETGLVVLSGTVEVRVKAASGEVGETLSTHDGIYIPRDAAITLRTAGEVDIAEFFAPVEGYYPLQVSRAAERANDPGLKFTTGGPGSTRHLNMVLAKNIQAGRLVVGFTHSDPGNWTSWPPHEHERLLEELYVYFDMPEPGFAIQMVYTNAEQPELVTVVRDGDAVLMPGGYHPNVAAPGHRIGFLWAMAAHREVEDRLFGVVNVQPGFNQGSTGLEKGR